MTNKYPYNIFWFIFLLISLVFIIGCAQQFSRVKDTYEPSTIADNYYNNYQIHNLDCTDSNMKTWAKVFGGPGFDEVESIQQTSDGGFVVAGWRNSGPTDSEGEKQYDILLFKVDADGNKLWEKIYGGNETDFPRSMQMTSDGGFILGGATRSLMGGDAYLIKTDALGNLQWEQNYGICGTNSFGNEISAVQQTADGGYIASGWSLSSCSSIKEYNFLLKTNAKGNKVWETDYVFWRESYIDTTGRNSVIQTADGGYAVLGYVHHWIPSKVYGQNIYLMKADADGNILWNRTYENQLEPDYEDYAEPETLIETDDGGYLIMGRGLGGILLLKTDADGNKLWTKGIRGLGVNYTQNVGYHIEQTTEGGFFIIGRIHISGDERRTLIIGDKIALVSERIYFLNTDADGNIISEAFGDIVHDGHRIWPVLQTSDGGYINAVTTFLRVNTMQANTSDILIVKLNENGVVCNLTYSQP